MSNPVRVYVNGTGVDAPAGGTVLDAVRAFDASLADAIAAGERMACDSRGLPVPNDAPLYHGAIFRVVRNRQGQRAESED